MLPNARNLLMVIPTAAEAWAGYWDWQPPSHAHHQVRECGGNNTHLDDRS